MAGIIDLHVHSGPSLASRHSPDPATKATLDDLGVDTFVLKAHEGSTAERAALLGPGVVGGVVLNSPVGGANPDAVDVAGRLGARIVWLPTSSSLAHQAQAPGARGHEVHDSFQFAPVPVVTDGHLEDGWSDVLDVVVEFDLVLASGHVPIDEALIVFAEAHKRGARRFLVNHPLLPFLRWSHSAAEDCRRLDVRVEIGVLADIGAGSVGDGTGKLAADYPPELLVFGSDLGFSGYPDFASGYRSWLGQAEALLGRAAFDRALSANGQELIR